MEVRKVLHFLTLALRRGGVVTTPSIFCPSFFFPAGFVKSLPCSCRQFISAHFAPKSMLTACPVVALPELYQRYPGGGGGNHPPRLLCRVILRVHIKIMWQQHLIEGTFMHILVYYTHISDYFYYFFIHGTAKTAILCVFLVSSKNHSIVLISTTLL